MSKTWDKAAYHRRLDRKRRDGECYSCASKAAPDSRRCEPCQLRQTTAQKQYQGKLVDEAPKPREPVCRCGLRLPCNQCLPTARDLAEARLSVE